MLHFYGRLLLNQKRFDTIIFCTVSIIEHLRQYVDAFIIESYHMFTVPYTPNKLYDIGLELRRWTLKQQIDYGQLSYFPLLNHPTWMSDVTIDVAKTLQIGAHCDHSLTFRFAPTQYSAPNVALGINLVVFWTEDFRLAALRQVHGFSHTVGLRCSLAISTMFFT